MSLTRQVLRCEVCDADIVFEEDIEINELIDCDDCTTEFEIISLNPLTIQEAPMESEDWGQ